MLAGGAVARNAFGAHAGRRGRSRSQARRDPVRDVARRQPGPAPAPQIKTTICRSDAARRVPSGSMRWSARSPLARRSCFAAQSHSISPEASRAGGEAKGEPAVERRDAAHRLGPGRAPGSAAGDTLGSAQAASGRLARMRRARRPGLRCHGAGVRPDAEPAPGARAVGCRRGRAVPTQSVPVSPPPITTTSTSRADR